MKFGVQIADRLAVLLDLRPDVLLALLDLCDLDVDFRNVSAAPGYLPAARPVRFHLVRDYTWRHK